MAMPRHDFEKLTTDERTALIGQLWHSLDVAVIAPLTPALAGELAQREAEADAPPEEGDAWDFIERQLRDRVR